MAVSTGAYGKMPSLGDFFRIGLDPGFVEPWDAWLQSVVAAARDALGERWTDCYMSAPIWRFTLAPGLAGAAGMTGVLMPSVDRVGRQFPLTLAAPAPADAAPADLHLSRDAAFAALEDIALDALDEAMTRDALAERLAALDPPASPPAVTVNREGAGLMTAAGADIAAGLAAPRLAEGFRSPSYWTAALDGVSRLIACEGLPPRALAVRLFDTSEQAAAPEVLA